VVTDVAATATFAGKTVEFTGVQKIDLETGETTLQSHNVSGAARDVICERLRPDPTDRQCCRRGGLVLWEIFGPSHGASLEAAQQRIQIPGKPIRLRLVTVAPWTLTVQSTCTPRLDSAPDRRRAGRSLEHCLRRPSTLDQGC
jgi:hypothetical protein